MKEEIIFLLGMGIVALLILALMAVVFIKEQRSITYVHLKTKNRYFLIEEGRMKIPEKGWVDSVIYSNNKGTFVREKTDFYNKFKKLSEWKEN